MSATTSAPGVLDHVRAYAGQVRAHLADLAPDQVEDLTDGLEADLAEALADTAGPVATGELPVVRLGTAPGGGASATMLDLTGRFGPAAAYAAELRAAAGLSPAPRGVRPPRFLRRPAGLLRSGVDRARAARGEVVGSLRASRVAGPVIRLLETLAPVWWFLRAWSWWVLCVGVASPHRFPAVERFVPATPGDWLLLVAFGALSVAYGKGWGTRRWWTAGVLGTAGVAAAANLVWAVPALADEMQAARWDGATAVEYVEVLVPDDRSYQPPAEGVYVDGMAVSNLFVYDADGNPLEGVQVFDDRGRPVRTTYDDGQQLWSLPGVGEAWRFVPTLDADGRSRWNAYPLTGAPESAWDISTGAPTLLPGEALRTPPPPFAKAPALVPPSAAPEGADDAG